MENRVHLYVTRKNFFTRLASVLLMYSLVARVVVFGFTKHAGTVGFWGQIVLPMAATLLYLFIILADGEECFYKTTIPVGMMALYGGICILHVIQSRLYISLFFIALMFLTLVYGEITSGVRKQMVWCLPFILLNTLVIVLYNNRPVVLGKIGTVWCASMPTSFASLLAFFCPLPSAVIRWGSITASGATAVTDGGCAPLPPWIRCPLTSW